MFGYLPELFHEGLSPSDLIGNPSGWVSARASSGLKRLLLGGWDILWHAGEGYFVSHRTVCGILKG